MPCSYKMKSPVELKHFKMSSFESVLNDENQQKVGGLTVRSNILLLVDGPIIGRGGAYKRPFHGI